MNRLFKVITNFWNASIQRQLILGIASVHLILMTLFISDLVSRQKSFLHEQSIQQTEGLATSLAVNSISWILADDVIGLEELISSYNSYPNLKYAIILSNKGKILGHTNSSYVGLYGQDSISLKLINGLAETTQLVNKNNHLEIGVPIFSNDEHIGWSRIAISQKSLQDGLNDILLDGIGYTLFAIIVGTLFAFLMARSLISGILSLLKVTEHVERGNLDINIKNNRKDELGKLSDSFNHMILNLKNTTTSINILNKEINEREKAEENNRKLQKQVYHNQKLESLGVLAGGIAHDFNNILTGIMGNAEYVRLKLSSDNPLLKNIENIEMGSNRAANLTKQMLAYSGKGQFVIESINLNVFIKDITPLIKNIVQNNTTIDFHLSDTVPNILADLTQMKQLLLSLLTNASEAIGEKSGIISINTGVVQITNNSLDASNLDTNISEGCYVWVEVSDTGMGMDKETQSKIFEPFFSTKFAGRGLGLAAVLGIVKGHEGSIEVKSDVNTGTQFKVLFPCSPDET